MTSLVRVKENKMWHRIILSSGTVHFVKTLVSFLDECLLSILCSRPVTRKKTTLSCYVVFTSVRCSLRMHSTLTSLQRLLSSRIVYSFSFFRGASEQNSFGCRIDESLRWATRKNNKLLFRKDSLRALWKQLRVWFIRERRALPLQHVIKHFTAIVKQSWFFPYQNINGFSRLLWKLQKDQTPECSIFRAFSYWELPFSGKHFTCCHVVADDR